MNPHEFQEWPKMGRYSRECVITEKIDGTNAQIYVADVASDDVLPPEVLWQQDGRAFFAGSRNQWITPQKDNAGFARWALENREELMHLGPGRHFGEWWGAGIQRKYGMKTKAFSLFNSLRWIADENKRENIKQMVAPSCCRVVPIIRRGLFSTQLVEEALQDLIVNGSKAAPGFMDPEGIVIYHVAGDVAFKKTIKDDEIPKSLVGKV